MTLLPWGKCIVIDAGCVPLANFMRTGKVLYAIGDIRRAQGKWDDVLDFFTRALAIFRSTIGYYHYATADTCYRLAEQLIRGHSLEAR